MTPYEQEQDIYKAPKVVLDNSNVTWEYGVQYLLQKMMINITYKSVLWHTIINIRNGVAIVNLCACVFFTVVNFYYSSIKY